MKIAIPTANGRLCMHFGHCEKFVFVEVEAAAKSVIGMSEAVPPPHEPDVLPKWLHEQQVNVIIAGGMGMRAQQFFNEYGIEVVVGAPAEKPDTVALNWMNGTLVTGGNVCDH